MTGARPRTDRRRPAGLRAGVTAVATAAVMLLVLAGCGNGTARLQEQKAVLDYQSAIGAVNAAIIGPGAAGQDTTALRTTLRRYRAVVPPPHLRGLHARLVSSLQTRIRATTRAGRALARQDGAAFRAQLARGARAQARLSRALQDLAAFAQQCRRHRADC